MSCLRSSKSTLSLSGDPQCDTRKARPTKTRAVKAQIMKTRQSGRALGDITRLWQKGARCRARTVRLSSSEGHIAESVLAASPHGAQGPCKVGFGRFDLMFCPSG